MYYTVPTVGVWESQGGASATLSAKSAGLSGEKATEAPVMTAAVAPVGVSAMKAAAAPVGVSAMKAAAATGKKTVPSKIVSLRMPLVPSEAMSQIELPPAPPGVTARAAFAQHPPVRVPAVSEVRRQPFLSTNQ